MAKLWIKNDKAGQIVAPWYRGYATSQGRKTIFGHDKDGNNGYCVMILDKETPDVYIEQMIEAVNSRFKGGVVEDREGNIKEIALIWCADDVGVVAEEMNVTLTKEEISDVLSNIKYNHDASNGVCWDTIRYYVQEVINDRGEE